MIPVVHRLLRNTGIVAGRKRHVPDFLDARCVHTKIGNATCTRCVDVCPRNAWQLDDDRLRIDSNRCDGCGLCGAACSESALTHTHKPLPVRGEGFVLAFSACEHAGVSAVRGVVACLGSLGVRDILELYREGCKDMVVSCGDCDACSRGSAPRLETLIANINRSLQSGAHPPIRLRRLAAERWQALLGKLSPQPGMDAGRRGFLARAIDTGIKQGIGVKGLAGDGAPPFAPPGTLLADGSANQIMPAVPVLDAMRCDGCDACAKLCPHEAITLDESGADARVYRTDASRCTGCGICVDVCEQEAITVDHWAAPPRAAVRLEACRCRRCGAPFHVPEEQNDNRELCRVCHRVNHYSNLHQVLD